MRNFDGPQFPPQGYVIRTRGHSRAIKWVLVVISISLGQAYSPVTAFYYTLAFSSPIVEEFSKGSLLFILFWWKKDEFDGVVDGIVYAGMIGLGFAMTENFLYYGKAALAGGDYLTVIFRLRGIESPFAHPLFTSMTGIGLGLARQSS